MARRQGGPVRIEFGGGWATDFGTAYEGAPDGAGLLAVPWCLAAENVTFNLKGWPRKIGGSTRLNATAVTEGASVAQTFQGLIDYWKQGTAGSEAQDRVAVVGTKYMKEDVDGTWDDIVTGKETGKHPCFTIFKDDCIISTTSNTDVPYVWDQSAGAILGGTPPNFAFAVVHKNRVFAAGVATNPSRLYYCELLGHEDWTGDGAGSIDVDPDDGDRITGLASHKGVLVIFKGPHKLSIHILKGASPSGDDPFALEPFITSGVGAAGHNSIVRVGTPGGGEDLVFVSPSGVHSLQATANYGNFTEAFLSAPIQTYFTDSVNQATLGTVWGVNYAEARCLVWSVSASGATAKTKYLVYHYGFTPARWTLWTGYVNAHCLALLEASNRKRLYAGLTTGFVEQLHTATRTTAAATAYTAKVQTPYLAFGDLGGLASIEQAYLGLVPKSAELTVATRFDRSGEQTALVDQSGGGALWGTARWGVDTWGGARRVVKPLEVPGVFREASFEFRQGTSGGDMEPQSFEVVLRDAGASEETL